MKSSGGSFAHLGLHIGEDWSTFLSTYPDHPPILDIDSGSTTIAVYIGGTQVTQAAVDFARELAARTAEYAAEMARIHARHNPGDGAPDGEAA